MGPAQRDVMCVSINNQIRYYEDKIRDLKMDAAEYTKPSYSGEIPELTAIEQAEYDAIMAEVGRYEKLKAKEVKRLKKIKK